MNKPLLLGTVLGAIVLFFWGFFYHGVLPVAEQTLHPFSNEEQITPLIVAGATRSGTYLIPNYPSGATAEQKKAVEERVAKGPTVVAAVRLESFNFGQTLVVQFVINLLTAFLLTWLVLVARPATLAGRSGFLVIVAMAGWAARSLPSWNWYSFGIDYTISELVDLVVGFGLTGLVIGKVVPK
jgi:hypothetical protein